MLAMASYMHIADMRRLGRPPATLLQRDLADLTQPDLYHEGLSFRYSQIHKQGNHNQIMIKFFHDYVAMGQIHHLSYYIQI